MDFRIALRGGSTWYQVMHGEELGSLKVYTFRDLPSRGLLT